MSKPKSATHRLAVAGAIVLLLIVIVGMVMPSPRRHRHGEPRVLCASHLKHISQAILLYSMENHGALPASLVVALTTQEIATDVFVCPSTETVKADSNDAFAAEPDKHCDYVYVGDRLPMTSDRVPPWAILAFDREPNHDRQGINVLFGDGHVEFVQFAPRGKPTPWWDDVQAQIARGDRPVMLPTSATQPAR